MEPKIENLDIQKKLTEWGLILPHGLAFFPENFEQATSKDEFIFAEPLTEVKKIFRFNNFDVEIFGNPPLQLRARKSADLYLPAIFIGVNLISQNQAAVSVALSVLANYVTDFFKGTVGKKNVSLDVLIEKTNKKTITKIKYTGDAEGIKSLVDIIKQQSK